MSTGAKTTQSWPPGSSDTLVALEATPCWLSCSRLERPQELRVRISRSINGDAKFHLAHLGKAARVLNSYVCLGKPSVNLTKMKPASMDINSCNSHGACTVQLGALLHQVINWIGPRNLSKVAETEAHTITVRARFIRTETVFCVPMCRDQQVHLQANPMPLPSAALPMASSWPQPASTGGGRLGKLILDVNGAFESFSPSLPMLFESSCHDSRASMHYSTMSRPPCVCLWVLCTL